MALHRLPAPGLESCAPCKRAAKEDQPHQGCSGCTGCGCLKSAQYANHTDGLHRAPVAP